MKPLIVLTLRMGSERYPGKVLAQVGGKPLAHWIAKRLSTVGEVAISCPREKDQSVLEWARTENYLYCAWDGDPNDVLGRIMQTSDYYYSNPYIMRGLGDMPFPEALFIQRATEVMEKYDAQSFAWMLSPWTWPVYGAREYPMHRSVWEEMNANATVEEREHPDMYYHRHRDHFKTVYHEPPLHYYFRPHRTEVDYPEDVEMLRAVYDKLGHWPDMREFLDFLDNNHDISAINNFRAERTGPLTSYPQEVRDQWAKEMAGKSVVTWDDIEFKPPRRGMPVYCSAGTCLLGYSAKNWLHLLNGTVIRGPAQVACPCGTGKVWHTSSIG